MTPQEIAILITFLCALGITLGYVVGWRRGVDSGWCQHHFECIAKERARRDARGRFRTVRGVRKGVGV